MNGQSDTVIIALAIITLIGTLTTTIVGAIVAIMTRSQNSKIERTQETAARTQEAVNGFTHELMTAKSDAARAEGINIGAQIAAPGNGGAKPHTE